MDSGNDDFSSDDGGGYSETTHSIATKSKQDSNAATAVANAHAEPTAAASAHQGAMMATRKKISFKDNNAPLNPRFCPNCAALWYPVEDKQMKRLMLKCRQCGNSDVAHSPLVSENNLKKKGKTELSIYSDQLIYDATLQQSTSCNCPACDHNEAVFLMAHNQGKTEAMKLVFICKRCKHKWIR